MTTEAINGSIFIVDFSGKKESEMLKKALFFTIGTALPLVMAIAVAKLTFHIFSPEQISKDSNILMMMLATLFSPVMVAVIVPFFAGKSAYWTTELVGWSGCFSMLYMGFVLIATRMIGIYGIGMGILMVVMASTVVARRLEEKRWRQSVVGAYNDEGGR